MDPEALRRARAEFQLLLDRARGGCREALGELLETFRKDLLQRSNQQIDSDLRPKAAPSDLVQDTILEALHDFPQFQGKSEAEFVGWLLRILQHNMRNFQRCYRDGAKRELAREVHLDEIHSATALGEQLTANTPSPTSVAIEHEEAARFRRALDELPQATRLVVLLRIGRRLPFEAIAAKLDVSTEAVRQAWHRALRHLGGALAE